jgi:ionotropic glutamate receptor
VNVGVVLDLASLEANIALSCINMALSDFYAFYAFPNLPPPRV